MKLKDMLYALWQKTKAPVATRSVTVNLPTTGNLMVGITAPSVNGYTFLCWLQPATVGWVGSCYVEGTGAAQTKVWFVVNNNGQPVVAPGGRVDVSALYIRTDLA